MTVTISIWEIILGLGLAILIFYKLLDHEYGKHPRSEEVAYLYIGWIIGVFLTSWLYEQKNIWFWIILGYSVFIIKFIINSLKTIFKKNKK